jgi:hypothetical protein
MTPSSDESGCPKCGHRDAITDSISTTGGGISKLFDVQTKTFEVVSCANCGYSEFYRSDRQRGSDLADIFFG